MMFSQGAHPTASSHLLAVSQPLSPAAADGWLLAAGCCLQYWDPLQVCPSVGRGGQEGSLLPSLMTPDCSSRSQDLSSIFRSQGAQDMTFPNWGARDIIPEAHLVRVCFLRPDTAFPPA